MKAFLRLWLQRRKHGYATCVNDVDPVTQESVACIDTPFKVVLNAARQYVLLDALPTAQYILASGKAVNLVTQQELLLPELRRLDRLLVGKCVSVVSNLEAAREAARHSHDRQQICQAMEVQPALWFRRLLDAPFSVYPHEALEILPLLVHEYNAAMRDYFVVDEASAQQFHVDNMAQLRAVDYSTGDMLIHENVLLQLDTNLDFSAVEVIDDEEDDDDSTIPPEESETSSESESEEDDDDVVVVVDDDDDAGSPGTKRQRVL